MKCWLFRPSKLPDRVERYNRFMLGHEAMLVQGFPADWLSDAKASNDQLQDIAGNAFGGTVFAAIYVALLATVGPAKVEALADFDQLVGMLT